MIRLFFTTLMLFIMLNTNAHASPKCDKAFNDFNSKAENILLVEQGEYIDMVFKGIYEEMGVHLKSGDISYSIDFKRIKKYPNRPEVIVMTVSDIHVNAQHYSRDFRMIPSSFEFSFSFRESENFDSLGEYKDTTCSSDAMTFGYHPSYYLKNLENGKVLNSYSMKSYVRLEVQVQ